MSGLELRRAVLRLRCAERECLDAKKEVEKLLERMQVTDLDPTREYLQALGFSLGQRDEMEGIRNVITPEGMVIRVSESWFYRLRGQQDICDIFWNRPPTWEDPKLEQALLDTLSAALSGFHLPKAVGWEDITRHDWELRHTRALRQRPDIGSLLTPEEIACLDFVLEHDGTPSWDEALWLALKAQAGMDDSKLIPWMRYIPKYPRHSL